ncbi:branched-chain amino acid aminotransferase/4-amino-4-deoxychorismate lyase [Mycobacteroides abscessus subsp. massiliense]|nr:branched-chain amino acid aminotransferase/4-amino-4-deoxychorismate lyase [Mycobacteroides abscessus subsp. massiliense]
MLGLGVCQAIASHRDRVADQRADLQASVRGTGVRGVDRHAGTLTDHLQLVDGAGTLQVAGHQKWRMPLSFKPFRELSGKCRLTGTLQTREHDNGRRSLGKGQLAGLPTEDADQLLVDDLDDLLRRVQRTGHLGALGALLDAGDEGTDDGQRHIGFEQRQPDGPAGRVELGVGQTSLTP